MTLYLAEDGGVHGDDGDVEGIERRAGRHQGLGIANSDEALKTKQILYNF
jgi:hypothetical protein